MRFKDNNVKVHGISPELVMALVIANEIYYKMGADFVITSLNDGAHKAGSKHYIGDGADIRTRNLTGTTVEEVATLIRARLTTDYDVVVESDHIHIEYDPKS